MSAEQRNKNTRKLVILRPGEATEWQAAQNDNSQGKAVLIRKILIWGSLAASAGGAAYIFL